MDEEREKFNRETSMHVMGVQNNMQEMRWRLDSRAQVHDASKFQDPEATGFMAMARELKLADTTYGSDEYRAILKKYKDSTIGPHYAANDHHPEHHEGGYKAMNLFQKMEMLADWYAATKRMKDGDLARSILVNADRFGYDMVEAESLRSTAKELGWLND